MIQSLGMKRVVVSAAVLALLGGLALMTEPIVPNVLKLAAFIPSTIGPYVSEADQTFDAETIFDYIDGAGEVYRSYNMKLLVSRRFHKDGKPDIVVDFFDMGSPDDAFGVFTHDLDGEDAAIGQGSTYKAGLLSFWKDRYFGSVFAEEETAETKRLVLELGRRIAAAVPGEGAKPAVLAYLPLDGLGAGRVRFFHNHSVLNYHYFVADTNILLLDQKTDAVLADYGGKGDRSRLLVVACADAVAAAKAGESFALAYLPEAREKGAVKTENGRWTAVRVHGKYVVIVFDMIAERAAADRLDAVVALMKDFAEQTKGGEQQ
jgi:hypothetical protein